MLSALLQNVSILRYSTLLVITVTTAIMLTQTSPGSSANAYSEPPLVKAKNAQTKEAEADQLYKKSSQLWSQGLYREALPDLERALALFKQSGNRKKEANALTAIGVVHDNLGYYVQALDDLKQALAIRRAIGDQAGESRTLNNIGLVFDRSSDPTQALNYLQQALVVVRERHDRPMAGVTLNNIGSVYTKLGKYSQASEAYQQALADFRAVEDRFGEGTTLRNLGEVDENTGQYANALQYYQQALTVVQKIGDRFGEGAALNRLGDIYTNLGQYDQALKHYQEALSIRRSLKDSPLEGVTLNSIGKTYSSQGQYTQSLQYYEKALAIFRFLNEFPQEERTLNKIGDVYKKVMINDRALNYFQQALSIRGEVAERPMKWVVLNNIGEAYSNLRQYPESLDSYQEALKIVQRARILSGEWVVLSNLGKAYENQGQYTQALESYQQALAVVQKVGDLAGKGTILNNIGRLYLRQGEYPKAEATLFEAIQVLESLRPGLTDINKVSIFERQVSSYRLLQQALVAQKKTTIALEISERGRARAFVELLASKLLSAPKGGTPIEFLKIEQIQKIAREQNATLVEYSLITTDVAEKSENSQRKLNSMIYVWVVQPSGEIKFEQIDLKLEKLSLEQFVITSRAFLGVRGRSDSIAIEPIDPVAETESLQNFSRLLIQPIAPYLPGDPNARVIIIPQGELFLVPFVALQDMNGKRLIENHTILTAPAIQVLSLTHQKKLELQPKNLLEALVIGNPTMPKVAEKLGGAPKSLSPLAGAEQEAKAIASILNTEAFIGSRATKSSILPKFVQARIVHLATHGLLDDFKGLGTPGAIALAPSGTGEINDGLLTANEILDLKLNAELVVLSACDTGRGRITGDGVIGLSRSLITAGVPSVIVSLWSVPDAPTAELMVEFYRNWREEKMDKAQALRQAMLATMKSHPKPKDWAAFTLIGEAE